MSYRMRGSIIPASITSSTARTGNPCWTCVATRSAPLSVSAALSAKAAFLNQRSRLAAAFSPLTGRKRPDPDPGTGSSSLAETSRPGAGFFRFAGLLGLVVLLLMISVRPLAILPITISNLPHSINRREARHRNSTRASRVILGYATLAFEHNHPKRA